MIKRNAAYGAILLSTCLAVSAGSLRAADGPEKTSVDYGQLLADKIVFDHADILGATLYARMPGQAQPVVVGHAGASTQAAFPAGGGTVRTAPDGTVEVDQTLVDETGQDIGSLAIVYRAASGSTQNRQANSAVIRDDLSLVIPKRDTLFDPYVKGYDGHDTLAQRINQTLLARHPDVNVIAIHLTAPGDAKNKVWGINRPNFLGRESDEVDTDTEKTGKIVMQVIPSSHRMEVHMPLLSPDGQVIGTLCTVYFWKTPGEAADYYGRSLGIMEEARLLTPADRGELFKP